MIIIEGIGACFFLLISCVVGIAYGPEGLVSMYEKEVQDRVVEKGLITRERIKKNANMFKLFGILPFFVYLLSTVYWINGARGFAEGFWQMTAILLIQGLFDRLFIDWYWVGKTKAWIIPGTEDLMPYIYGKTLVMKWVITLIGYPVIAALLSLIMSFVIK